MNIGINYEHLKQIDNLDCKRLKCNYLNYRVQTIKHSADNMLFRNGVCPIQYRINLNRKIEYGSFNSKTHENNL